MRFESVCFAWGETGHFKFPFLFSDGLVVLGLSSNQAEPPCEKPTQLNREEYLG